MKVKCKELSLCIVWWASVCSIVVAASWKKLHGVTTVRGGAEEVRIRGQRQWLKSRIGTRGEGRLVFVSDVDVWNHNFVYFMVASNIR